MRLLSVHPATTQLLFLLGAGNMLVGRSDLCTAPQAALTLPSIGRPDQITMEAITAFGPELVFFSHGQLPGAAASMYYDPQSIEEIEQQTKEIAARLGKQVEADLVLHELALLVQKIKEKSIPFVPAKVHVVYEQQLLSPLFVEQMLGITGAVIVLPQEAQILFGIADDEHFLEKQIVHNNWKGLQAVQHERTFTIPSSALYPTPGVDAGLRQLAKILHGIDV